MHVNCTNAQGKNVCKLDTVLYDSYVFYDIGYIIKLEFLVLGQTNWYYPIERWPIAPQKCVSKYLHETINLLCETFG